MTPFWRKHWLTVVYVSAVGVAFTVTRVTWA